MVGIISYGVYIPNYRLRITEIAQIWGKNGEKVSSSLGVVEKAVAGRDEDAITLGYESARRALERINLSAWRIGSVFVGSESHPYAVNPSSTSIAEFLGAGNDYFASDLEFACKAATTGLILTLGLIQNAKVDYGLVVGTDCAQAKPHDILEYTAASASVSLILGRGKDEVVAEVVDYCSYSSDTPDFWRRDGISYPSHGGRFTGEPAYFRHVISAAEKLFEKTGMKPQDFSYCVFHMPNGKFPREAAGRLGFNSNQLAPSLIVRQVGNPYSASSLLGLASVLDIAEPNQYIFLVSYGSGAGSDALILKTNKNLKRLIKEEYLVRDFLTRKKYISYAEYLKLRGKI